jgi:hypothetical protein
VLADLTWDSCRSSPVEQRKKGIRGEMGEARETDAGLCLAALGGS